MAGLVSGLVEVGSSMLVGFVGVSGNASAGQRGACNSIESVGLIYINNADLALADMNVQDVKGLKTIVISKSYNLEQKREKRDKRRGILPKHVK